jgi:hypothetical protein
MPEYRADPPRYEFRHKIRQRRRPIMIGRRTWFLPKCRPPGVPSGPYTAAISQDVTIHPPVSLVQPTAIGAFGARRRKTGAAASQSVWGKESRWAADG